MPRPAPAPRWLVLFHQIPPVPAYLRVKIGRRLQSLGAVALKNSVYALPYSEGAREDFAWVIREIAESGGEAALCEARFVEGLSDQQVEALFQDARARDYERTIEQARALAASLERRSSRSAKGRSGASAQLRRLESQFAATTAIDFFEAPGREIAEGLIAALGARLRESTEPRNDGSAAVSVDPSTLQGRTWVTRRGIHVDRIASVWLIRHFIDPEARFKFVPARGYEPRPGEIRFDMYEAEFTHDGERCTFEVLLDRLGFKDAALRAIGEIVHDLDLKDAKFGRSETFGVGRLIDGLAASERDDETRLARGCGLFGDLYAALRRKSK
jgi:hypothetical protein